MATSFVGSAEWLSTTSNSDIRATIHASTQVGDLILVGYGNVANEGGLAATPQSGWVTIEETLASTNAYFIMLGKIATSTEVSAAGSDISVATYGNGTNGQTNRASATLTYRGTATTVATAVIASNHNHETTPTDETINTLAATATAATQWYAMFFAMAAGSANGDQTTGSFSSDAGTMRQHAASYNGSTNAGVSAGDSNGTITAASHSRNGTWSINSTRLNASIAIIAPAADTDASAGAVAGTATANTPVAAIKPTAGSVSATATANTPLGAIKPSAGHGAVTATANNPTVSTSTNVNAPAGHASATVTANNASATVKPSAGHASATVTANNATISAVSGGGTTQAPAGLASVSVGAFSPIVLGPPVADLAESKTLILGPGTIYIADFGAVEPVNAQAGSTPSTEVWTDLGGIWGGVELHIEEEWKTIDLLQVPGEPIRRLQKRKLEVTTELAEATLLNLSRVLNDSAPTSGAGFQTYSAPLAIDQATVPTYRALLIQGWAPRVRSDTRKHRQRLIIMRKCLSISGVSTSYKRDGQTTFKVTWAVHYVDGTTAPFRVIDEGP